MGYIQVIPYLEPFCDFGVKLKFLFNPRVIYPAPPMADEVLSYCFFDFVLKLNLGPVFRVELVCCVQDLYGFTPGTIAFQIFFVCQFYKGIVLHIADTAVPELQHTDLCSHSIWRGMMAASPKTAMLGLCFPTPRMNLTNFSCVVVILSLVDIPILVFLKPAPTLTKPYPKLSLPKP